MADPSKQPDSATQQPPSSSTSSSSFRETLGEWVVDAVEWTDTHRRGLVVGSLLATASGAALLLRLHGLPGYTCITTQAQLADRLLRQQQRRQVCLPVLLAGASVDTQSSLLQVSVLHYPLLQRWTDRYRGRRPAPADGMLTCSIAGLQGVHDSVGPLLQQHLADTWATGTNSSRLPRPLQLRVFALTHAADEKQQPDSHTASSDSSALNDSQQQQPQQQDELPALRQELWAELWVQGLPPAALKAAAVDAAGKHAAAAAVPAGWLSWLPQRKKRDVAELLLRQGLARMADEEQYEWLGVRQARWRAYHRASQRAARLGLGLHAADLHAAEGGLLARWWGRLRMRW